MHGFAIMVCATMFGLLPARIEAESLPGSCVTTVSPSPIVVGEGGAFGFRVSISAPTGCHWTATAGDPWIHFVTSSSTLTQVSGTGSATIQLEVYANPSSTSRTGRITVDGADIAIEQSGVPCRFVVAPPSFSFGSASGRISVLVWSSTPDCSWRAESSVSWVTIAPGPFAGNGGAILSIDSNDSGSVREGLVTVAGTAIPVRQGIVRRRPVLDFDGDGRGDIFLYNEATGLWSIVVDNPYPGGSFVSAATGLWAPGWQIQAADFNGDGLADLFLYNPSSGQWFKAINRGLGTFDYFGYWWAPGWQVTVADFNGDGSSDLFLYNPTTGRWFQPMTVGDGDFDYSRNGAWAPGWSITAGDFDGDRRDDLFLYNRSDVADGNDGRWFWMLSAADGSLVPRPGPIRWAGDWTITPADLDADGTTELLLSRGDGTWATVKFTPEGERYGYGTWTPGVSVTAGDFNGDDRSDFLLYDPASGHAFEVITGPDGSFTSYGPFAWATGWHVATGDFAGDGRAELALVNPALAVAVKGVPLADGLFVNASNVEWSTGWTTVITR